LRYYRGGLAKRNPPFADDKEAGYAYVNPPCGSSLHPAAPLICPGKSANWLSSPLAKNISLNPSGKSLLQLPPSCPTEGRAHVTNAGRDAVDVVAPLTNGADADGEVVWS
jgi:hypothetical protein